MKFKVFDSDTRKRKRLAAQALAEIRALSAANYPLVLLFDKVPAGVVDRAPGESWCQAFARNLDLELEQLRDFAAGLIKTGMYQSKSDAKPTTKELISYFRGWSALLLEVERELAITGPD